MKLRPFIQPAPVASVLLAAVCVVAVCCRQATRTSVKVIGGTADDKLFPKTLLLLLFDQDKRALASAPAPLSATMSC